MAYHQLKKQQPGSISAAAIDAIAVVLIKMKVSICINIYFPKQSALSGSKIWYPALKFSIDLDWLTDFSPFVRERIMQTVCS